MTKKQIIATMVAKAREYEHNTQEDLFKFESNMHTMTQRQVRRMYDEYKQEDPDFIGLHHSDNEEELREYIEELNPTATFTLDSRGNIFDDDSDTTYH